MAETCAQSFYENIPPSFCWKRGLDVGTLPTDCPAGFFRSTLFCFQNCKPGWKFDGIAFCDKICPPDTTSLPLVCTHFDKDPTKIWSVGKESYLPKTYTNFEDEVPCPIGMWKILGLCYRDCNNIGLRNCGPLMCASDLTTCGTGVIDMSVDFLTGVAKTVSFVLTFGADSPAVAGVNAAKTALKTLVKKVGWKLLGKGIDILKYIATHPDARKRIIDSILNRSVEKLKDYKVDPSQSKDLQVVCTEVGNSLLDKAAKEDPNTKTFDIEKIDVLEFKNIIYDCTSIKNASGGIACAKSILKSLETIDPTGLAGMASAFMHPICDV